MRGLLIKDFINIKKQLITFSVFIVLYVVLSLQSDSATVFQGVIVILFAMLPITALAYDERAKWDKYMIAFPVSRKQIVLEKYLLGVIASIVAGLIGLLFELAVNLIKGQAFQIESLAVLGVFSVFALFFLAFNLPIMFKFGTEKGRFFIIALSVLLIAVPGFFMGISVSPVPEETIFNGIIIGSAAVVVLFFLSMFISVKIYEKKDF